MYNNITTIYRYTLELQINLYYVHNILDMFIKKKKLLRIRVVQFIQGFFVQGINAMRTFMYKYIAYMIFGLISIAFALVLYITNNIHAIQYEYEY